MDKTPQQIDALICMIIIVWFMVGVLIGALSNHIQYMTYLLGKKAPEKQVRYIVITLLFWPLACFIYRYYNKKMNYADLDKEVFGLTDINRRKS